MASRYEALFGSRGRGRPPGPESVVRTGNTELTEKARRRAVRVLVHDHSNEFEVIFKQEMEHLRGRNGSC